jgi:excisionase family DNA binding protein
MSNVLLTAREVADRLGVTPETVLRWVEIRGLPARRLTSRAIRFREDELEAWIDERATAGAADRGAPATRRRARRAGAYAAVGSASPATPPRVAATTEED